MDGQEPRWGELPDTCPPITEWNVHNENRKSYGPDVVDKGHDRLM
jgi:hypothetical protein